MATEYGIGYSENGADVAEWVHPSGKPFTRESAENVAREEGYVLIAREVSEPRIVSIRA